LRCQEVAIQSVVYEIASSTVRTIPLAPGKRPVSPALFRPSLIPRL
jgi:hypothetical protein